jgi:hypothetical protein
MSYESVQITVQPATVENVGILSYPVRELVTVNVTPPSTITSNTWGSIVGTLSSQTDLQDALNLKANLSGPTFTGTVTLPSTTSIGNVSATEIGYVDGVTSAIQTQLNAKAPIASPTFTGTVTATHIEGKVTGTELYCKAGQTIGAGQVVYVTGASGQNIIIGLAKADVESTSSKTIGVCQDALANNGFGYVVTEGKMTVSISASTANEGDPIWLSPTTAGEMLFGAANKPSAPDHIVYLGVVTRKTGSTVVEILVKVQNGAELDELSDVAITSPVSGQALMRGATLWTNRSLVIADITDATTYVPFLAAASNTFTGLASFTSTTRPTSSGTGAPAATSLMTRDDVSNRYRLTRISADTSVNNTITPQVALSLSVVSGKTYFIKAVISLQGTVNTGTRHGITFPAGSTVMRFTRKRASSYIPVEFSADLNFGLTETATNAEIEGVLVCNVSGNVSLTFAQNTSHADNITCRTYTSLQAYEF